MDLSPHAIYTSLAALLSQSQEFQVWYEQYGESNATFGLEPCPLIHAVFTATDEHFTVRLDGDKIIVDRIEPLATGPCMELELNDPRSLTELEDFFFVESVEDFVKPVATHWSMV